MSLSDDCEPVGGKFGEAYPVVLIYISLIKHKEEANYQTSIKRIQYHALAELCERLMGKASQPLPSTQ
jgi:hypothetical protein